MSQLLVQWQGVSYEDYSWEDLDFFKQLYLDFHLKDDVLYQERGKTYMNQPSESITTRIKQRPLWLKDYAT